MRRRDFLAGLAAAGAGAGISLGRPAPAPAASQAVRAPYKGPNVVIVRFGGGVRRRETIASDETYSPFLRKVLAPRGVLFPRMEIASNPRVETSHGQGTLYILTGRYDRYEDVGQKFLGERFEPRVPTLFEALRKAYAIAPHEALIVNGEDRIDEEFYTFSNHLGFGIDYRSTVLSLYRYKLHVLRSGLASGQDRGKLRQEKLKKLAEMEDLDQRNPFRTVTADGSGGWVFHPDRIHGDPASAPALDRFWDEWAAYYGTTGLVNPRGDRLLTELASRAMSRLRPRLMMVNFNDPDYVHWGNATHYTRGVAVVDEGLKALYEQAQADPFYRDNTVFVVVPDCGRDSNPFMAVPFQHHFGSRSAHEIFCLVVGPGIARGRVVDKPAEQNSVASTVGQLMGYTMPYSEGPVLGEIFA